VVAHTGGLGDDEAVLAWVRAHAGRECVLAIDAPLFIPNQTGSRTCDVELMRDYWPRKIGVYPCNKTLFAKRPRSRLIRHRLESELGFSEATLTYFETYPHPAIVNLLELDERVAYKKGRVADRRAGLARLACGLRESLPAARPAVAANQALDALLVRDWQGLRGRHLKAAEDEIDALVCAYAAARWVARDREGSEIYGRPGEGMMIFPAGG
jgi:predicted RNase H-like nuclease